VKVYLHGGRAGQTFNIKGVQFIDGVAEVATLSKYLERYYNVKDYHPNQENADGLQIKEETKKEVASKIEVEVTVDTDDLREDIAILNKIVEARKKQLENSLEDEKPSLIDQMHEFNNWGQMRAFVKSVTGVDVNSKKKAIEVLTEFESKK